MQQGDLAASRTCFESGLAISRELNDKMGIALSLSFLGDLSRTENANAAAIPLFREALKLFREIDNKSAVSATMVGETFYIADEKQLLIKLLDSVADELGLTESNSRIFGSAAGSGSVLLARPLEGSQISFQAKYRW